MPGRVASTHAAAVEPRDARMAGFIGAGHRWLDGAPDPVRPDEGSA